MKTVHKTIGGLVVLALIAAIGGPIGLIIVLILSLVLLRLWKTLLGTLIYQFIGLDCLLLLIITRGSTIAIIITVIVYSFFMFRLIVSYARLSTSDHTTNDRRPKNKTKDHDQSFNYRNVRTLGETSTQS